LIAYCPPKYYEKLLEHDGMFLSFIAKHTYKRCLIAVKNNGLAIQYAKRISKQIMREAITENSIAIKYLNPKTTPLNMYLLAVERNAIAINCIPNEDVILELLRHDPHLIKDIRRPSIRMVTEAVARDGMLLQYINNPSVQTCMIAVEENPNAKIFVPDNMILKPRQMSLDDLFNIMSLIVMPCISVYLL
jgi:hypothetical protein